jgi:hypothetical protein
MSYLERYDITKNDFAYVMAIKLKQGWRNAVESYPSEKISSILKVETDLAQRTLSESGNSHKLEIKTGDLGLEKITILEDKAGLSLHPYQDAYISYNLRRASQVSALTPIIVRYLEEIDKYYTGKRNSERL